MLSSLRRLPRTSLASPLGARCFSSEGATFDLEGSFKVRVRSVETKKLEMHEEGVPLHIDRSSSLLFVVALSLTHAPAVR